MIYVKDIPSRTLPIGISSLGEQDIPSILELWNISGLPIRPCGRDRPELMAEEMRCGSGLWIGAWDEDRLVGVILANDDGRKGWLNRLAVHPDYRQRGIGRGLVEAAEARLRERGRGILAVLIDDDNPNSMDVFTHLGYKKEEKIIYFTKRGSSDV